MGSEPILIPSRKRKGIEHIGEGSFADVYLNNETNIIIKRINIEKITNQKRLISKNVLREYIQSEIDIIKNLSHDNIISFVKSDIQGDIYDIHLEYCKYGDLSNILKNESLFYDWRNSYGGFTGEFLKNFICQICDGLQYLHDLNIIHRDIKPNNILMSADYSFKICDFGFSCVDITKDKSLLTPQSELTVLEKKYFNKSGTPYYIAPEIYLETYYTTESDCWSLGITLYEMYFKNIPFPKMEKINEISEYLSQKESQLIIHDQIISKIAPKILKVIMIGLLTIEVEHRMSLYEVIQMISQNNIEEVELAFEIDDIIFENDTEKEKTNDDATWEQIDDLSSLINIGDTLSTSFLKWLKNTS